MSDDVIERDLGWNAIKRELERASRGEVTVGIHEDANAAEGALTTAQVGAFHEFGVGVPQRAWLGPTIDEKADELNDLGDRLYWGPLLDGKTTAKRGLSVIGQVAEDAIKAKIRRGDPAWPPLTQATKIKKARTIRGRAGRDERGRYIKRGAQSAGDRRAEFIAGDGDPLRDTGQMLNSIRHKVQVGEAGDA